MSAVAEEAREASKGEDAKPPRGESKQRAKAR